MSLRRLTTKTSTALLALVRVPPALCRVGSTLNQRFKGEPSDFFRLFCTSRTCSPKPGVAPKCEVLGQSVSPNHEHGRGNQPKQSDSFFRIQ